MRNMPNPKQVSDSLLIPIPTPDTVETVAMAVITQMMATLKNDKDMIEYFQHKVIKLFQCIKLLQSPLRYPISR